MPEFEVDGVLMLVVRDLGDSGDGFTSSHFLPGLTNNRPEVRIDGNKVAVVLNDNRVAIHGRISALHHRAVKYCCNRRAYGRQHLDAVVIVLRVERPLHNAPHRNHQV